MEVTLANNQFDSNDKMSCNRSFDDFYVSGNRQIQVMQGQWGRDGVKGAADSMPPFGKKTGMNFKKVIFLGKSTKLTWTTGKLKRRPDRPTGRGADEA